MTVAEKNQAVAIDLNRCIGCGVCVPACPSQSLVLEKKPIEVKPPETREALHDIIAAGRTGRLGKLKLIGKLIVDSVRTGRFDLVK
jgi:Fe-S-cluster-containing hydrogenase component 2